MNLSLLVIQEKTRVNSILCQLSTNGGRDRYTLVLGVEETWWRMVIKRNQLSVSNKSILQTNPRIILKISFPPRLTEISLLAVLMK